MPTRFEAARRRYKPNRIKYLLVAIAPPCKERFFYFGKVQTKDYLFLGVMKALYNCDDVKKLRRDKIQFLERFKNDGFYLIDSVDTPIEDRSKTRKEIRGALPSLQKKLQELGGGGVKIILISKAVYDVCFDTLSKGFNIINEEPIKFPVRGYQTKFNEKFVAILKKNGWKA